MNRREFIGSVVGGIATGTAVRTWPFRVYSFPTEFRILSLDELRRIYVDRAMAEISGDMANSPPSGVAEILCSSSSPVVIPCRVTTEMLVDAARISLERGEASRMSPAAMPTVPSLFR